MESGLKILLADNSPITLIGINEYLSSLGHKIVYEASNFQQAITGSNEYKPNLVISEYLLPGISQSFSDRSLFHLSKKNNILFYSFEEDISKVMKAINFGAKGYLSKKEPLESLAEAVSKVGKGQIYFSPSITQLIISRVATPNYCQTRIDSRLTRKEMLVLEQISEGKSNKEIAEIFKNGVRTIETHRERIMKKLDIHSIAGLTKFYVNGLKTYN